MARREILDLAELFVPADQLGDLPRQVRWMHTRLKRRRSDRDSPISAADRIIGDFPNELIATARDGSDQVAVRSKGPRAALKAEICDCRAVS